MNDKYKDLPTLEELINEYHPMMRERYNNKDIGGMWEFWCAVLNRANIEKFDAIIDKISMNNNDTRRKD